MKSKIYMAMIVALVVTTAGYNLYNTRNVTTLSNLALANVEALAQQAEVGDIIDNCVWRDNKYCYYVVITPNGNEAWEHWNMVNYY